MRIIHQNTNQLIGTILFFSLLFFVYSPVTSLSFSGPDDHWMLLKNNFVNHSSYNLEYFERIFRRVNNIQYSPLNTLYYSFIFKINGFDPYYFHLGNVLVHTLNAIAIFSLIQNILNSFLIKGNSMLISYLVTLFWAVHPLQVEVVAWISGSKILLCTFFTVLSFNMFITAAVNKKTIYYATSLICFIISFFFKEQAIITPVMFLLFLIFYKLVRFKSLKFYPGEVITLILSFALTICFGLHTINVNYSEAKDFPPIIYYPIISRIILIVYCFYFYFTNLIIPRGLHYHIEFPFRPHEPIPFVFFIYAIISLAIVISISRYIYKSKYKIYFTFCILIVLSQLALQLQIIPMTRPAIVADRYMYFPSIMLLLAIITIFVNTRKGAFAKLFYSTILASSITYFVLYSNQLVNNWHNLNLIKP